MSVLSSLVLPGQDLTPQINNHLDQIKLLASKKASPNDPPQVRLGFGIQFDSISERFLAVVAGPLHFGTPYRFWIGCVRTRYIPCVGDLILGVVTSKSAEVYKLDIGFYQQAVLNAAEGFSAASRRNRPNVLIGGVIFCRIALAQKDLDGPEVTCVEDPGSGVGGQEGLGYIKPTPTTCSFETRSITYTLDLQRPDNPTLAVFGKYFPFEIIVGANGRFVITTNDCQLTWLLGQAIVEAEDNWSSSRIESECQEILARLKQNPSSK